jgi:hypothetical protein
LAMDDVAHELNMDAKVEKSGEDEAASTEARFPAMRPPTAILTGKSRDGLKEAAYSSRVCAMAKLEGCGNHGPTLAMHCGLRPASAVKP